MRAAQSGSPEGEAALANLYRIYWFPLYTFARRRGHSPHDAQDLSQGFFMDLVERGTLRLVDQLKGKFRSFLLVSFQNYLSVEARRARRLKRGGAAEFVSLDMEGAEEHYLSDAAQCLTPEKLFDAQWAMRLLRQAMTRLQEEYNVCGKGTTFDALKGFLSEDETKNAQSNEKLAKLLGVKAASAKTVVHRFRKRYSVLVREEIARTVSDPAEIDEETHALCDALVISGSVIGETSVKRPVDTS